MDAVLQAVAIVATPVALLFIFIGVTMGIIVGAIPGLTGTMLIALTLPLTYHMASTNALMLLVAMYVGAVSGSMITATLLRIPGTPSSVMTTFDAYPLARDGSPGRALALGTAASFAGGMISWLFLIALSAPLANIAVHFTPWDYFTLSLMALVLIATVSQGSLIKGLLSGALGILAAVIGHDPSSGMPRLTFGSHDLENGFAVLPVVVGLFAVGKIFADLQDGAKRNEVIEVGSLRSLLLSVASWRRHAWNMCRSSLLGTWIGMLPGVGASIGSIVSYTVAKASSKEPQKFGYGSEEGIVASEAGNNSTVGGALIPLIALGIPGSVIDAILIGGLMLHGIQPGPMLFSTNPEIVYAIIMACLVGNIMMFFVMIGIMRQVAQLIDINRAILFPLILLFCVVGAYAYSNRIYDVWVMLGFGAVGFTMEKARIPLGPFVIGFVLAPVCETNLRTGLMISGGSFAPLVTEPLPLIFLIVSAVMFASPVFFRLRDMRRGASIVD